MDYRATDPVRIYQVQTESGSNIDRLTRFSKERCVVRKNKLNEATDEAKTNKLNYLVSCVKMLTLS